MAAMGMSPSAAWGGNILQKEGPICWDMRIRSGRLVYESYSLGLETKGRSFVRYEEKLK